MNEPTFTTQVNGITVTCHPALKGFKIFKKESSNVGYFGTYPEDKDNCGQVFMQFISGKCYVYSNVPKEVLDLAESADSIGKYYYKFIKGKFPEMPVDDHCIVEKRDKSLISDDDEEDWNFDQDFEFEADI